jgi:radical SAM superfamily enzyme YgiQ (UPF0313 family)
MKALLVYPEYPETFWNFKFALKFISKKAAYPPLGLLTVAAMLPPDWEKKLIDMNVTVLRDEDLRWADMVCISAMTVQKKSTREVIDRCTALGKTVVAGGPLFTSDPEDFADVDHLVLNEAEVTLPPFLHDLEHGNAGHIYTSTELADLSTTPPPSWELIDFTDYAALSIQLSRGCPYDCEFCNITSLFGRIPRLKRKEQIIAELERLYQFGWRGGVFFVDDNLIGHKSKVKHEMLPAIADWMQRRKHPFVFNSQVPVNLADDPELMDLMTLAGFASVFVGIESPDEACLAECDKTPNRNRDLMASVHKIQQAGLEVQGGFIVGFDSDTPPVFDRLIQFIQGSGIVTAMVGLLNAPLGTRLHERLMSEGRLLRDMSGDNTDSTMNFIPKMQPEILYQGYRRIVEHIYSPNAYYQRVKRFLREYRPAGRHSRRVKFRDCLNACKATVVLGIIERERTYYWRLLLWSLFRRPRLLPLAMVLTAYGFHFRKSFEQH